MPTPTDLTLLDANFVMPWVNTSALANYRTADWTPIAAAKKAGSTANVIYESKTGNFWYNDDGDSALVGALLFANVKGIPDTYWVAAGVM